MYNRVFVRWTTHNPSGLSAKDLSMARFCDDHAERMGEVGDGRGTGPKEWFE